MKKAKIILTVIAIFAIAGGTFAFKANRGAVVFCRLGNPSTVCPITLFDRTYTTTPLGNLFCGPDPAHCLVRATTTIKE